MKRWQHTSFALMMIGLGIGTMATCSQRGEADEFPQFRGPGGSGLIQSQHIPTNWSNEKNVAWRVQVPGAGWSQPIVWKQDLYVTTAVSDKEIRPKDFGDGVKMPQSMGLGGLAAPPKVNIDWQLHCYDAATGELRWSRSVCQGRPEYPIHPSNTYATESPVVDSNGVYAFMGATGKLAGFSHQGELKWSRDLGAFPTSSGFGTGSSLAIHDGKVYVQHFTEKSAKLLCVNALTGQDVWQKDRANNASSWSSPIVWKNDQRFEVLSSGGELVESFDPASGELLWSVNNLKAATACSIASDSKRIYFGGSDPMSKGPLVAIPSGASGDISPKKKNGKPIQCEWLVERAGPGMASPVSNGKHVFVVDNNILRCYDATNGNKVHERRLGQLKLVAASLLIVDDRLLVLDEAGNAMLLRADETCEEVGGGHLDDTFWATPAVAQNSIYLRGIDALYCIREQ